MGMGSAWADTPVFSLSNASTTTYSVKKSTLILVNGTHATISGGTVTIGETSGTARNMIGDNSASKFGIWKNTYFQITLSSALAVGDKISITPTSDNERTYYVATSATGKDASIATTKNSTSPATYTVVANDALVGKSVIYINNGNESSNFYFTALTITSAGGGGGGATTYTVSSAVLPEGKGSVTMKKTDENGDVITSGSSVEESTAIWMQATANTGYTFSSWSGGATSTDNPYTYASLDGNKTFTANFSAKTYTVTINANGGTGGAGSVTATYDAALSGFTAPTKSGESLTGYYTAASDGTKVINADGTLVASVSGYTDANGKWTKDDAATLYAQWGAVSSNKFQFVSNLKNETISASASEIAVTTSNYASTLTGGNLWYCNGNKEYTNKLGLDLGGNGAYLKIVLSQALTIGDVINFVEGNGKDYDISFTTSATRSTTISTSEGSYKVTSTDGLSGASTIYVWRVNNTTYVKSLTITSSDEDPTYAVSFEMGGVADEMDVMEEQEALPDPLPEPANVTDGYTFEGWYTDAGFTTPAEAGATLTDNATLYANYIIDTPTISPAPGDIYAGTAMTLSSDVAFTQVYAQWTGASSAFSRATATANPADYRVYNGEAEYTYNFTCANTAGTRYFAYMISDGTFYSVPAVTGAYTVSNKITIDTQPQGAMYVQGAPATALSVSATDTGNGTLSYQWKSSTDNSTWSDAAGTNNAASYIPSTATEGTTYYKCIVSSTSDAADVESNAVTVTVNAPAAYTVSFDEGVGSSTEVASITQASSDAAITLPSVKLKENYTFAGWYDSDWNLIGGESDSYTPSGNITLTARYNCMVKLEKGTGDGNVPTAKIKNTGEAVANGDYVLEGTTLTLTASPAANFTEWTTGMTGTDNPKDYVLNEYKRFVANYRVAEYTELFHTDFIESDGWEAGEENVLDGTTITSNEKTIDNTKVTFGGGSKSYTLTVNTTTGKLTYGSSNNLNANEKSTTPSYYMAIHLTGVHGSITVDFGSTSKKWTYALDDGNTGAITTAKTTLKTAATSFTIENLESEEVTLYLGDKGVSISELTITTPKTKLTANPAKVSLIGTASTASVKITTNSPGAVSITTAPDGAVATAVYDSGTKKITVTPVAAGETSVTVQVAASGEYPARELTIPISIEEPTITIKTQPKDLTCTQNEAADKTFTVAATVNTGNELTYQWYSCNAGGTGESAIAGAITESYTVNTTQKATVGSTYYFCRVTSAADGISKDTEVKSLTVSALSSSATEPYKATVFVGTKGNVLTYTDLDAETTITSGDSEASYTASISSGTLTITASATTTGTGTITLSDGIKINVTVKKHSVNLIWSAESKDYTKATLGVAEDGEIPAGKLPTLTMLYEDGTDYTGSVSYYSDDVNIAYFGVSGEDLSNSTTYALRYGGGNGGAKIYAYIAGGTDAEDVKASFDLRVQDGYSNSLPKGREVAVQQQYTLWKNETEKLVTITYGGYKYNGNTWKNKKGSTVTDKWGAAAAVNGLVSIDGYGYSVRNSDNDATDEYMDALQESDDFGSAWYAAGEGGTSEAYERIKPFRLPCRASYLMFTAHKSGKLTAYVWQNGVIGRGSNKNQIASEPRLGYWFDQDGWVQHPTGTVVAKQTIANDNARDLRSYGDYADMDAQLAGWDKDDDQIMKRKLKSKYCKDKDNLTDNMEDYELDNVASHDAETYPDLNPYYWGKSADVTANNELVLPTPERPIPHQNGYMIVNEGYVKYTIDVVAGKTYYFFGKMTKVGYAGMNFVEEGTENRQTEHVDLAANDVWSEKFGKNGTALKGNETTIYDEITVPSNYRIEKWNTICLPFAVNENQVEEVFGKGTQLAIFNGLRHDETEHIYYIRYLRHVDQNILPGQPYLIYPTGKAVEERTNQNNGGMAETGEQVATEGDVIGATINGATRLTFRNVIIEKGVTAQSYGCDVDADKSTTSYQFVGTDAPTEIVKYDLYNTPKTGALMRWMNNAAGSLNTYHAVIKAKDEEIKQDGISFAFSDDCVEKSWETSLDDIDDEGDDDVPTVVVLIEDYGVSDQGTRTAVADGRAYNLMGQEVNLRTAKGMVIVNGRKYIK